MTLQASILEITERATDSVSGFRAVEGGDNRQWFRAFDQLAVLRREAISASAHHLVVLADVAVLHANARGETARDAWRAAYVAVRDAILSEQGAS